MGGGGASGVGHPARYRRPWRFGSLVASVWVALLMAGCSASAPSTLAPEGSGAKRVAGLWWLLFWISIAVYVVVLTVLLVALMRRRRKGEVNHADATKFVVVAGVVVPFLVLTSVYLVGLRDLSALSEPVGGDDTADTRVTVVGHQWWWEVQYPDSGAVTANEVHIPVGVDVRIDLRTADVVHSFWVPELMPKKDLISGRTTTTWLHADQAGTYRGQCAEYCGLQHGNMAFQVIAQPRKDFDAWLAKAARPAREPSTAAQRRGQQVFEQVGCASCHTIRGVSDGDVGPDLTNVGSRWSIGAGAVDNTPGDLGGWVVDPQTIKPGNKMPPQPVPADELPDLIAYLRSLK